MKRRIAAARAVLVAAVLVASLGMTTQAEGYEREETFEKRVPLDGAKRVVIANSRGDVHVTGERGRSDVRCECVKMARGKNADESNALFDQMTIEVKRSGDDLLITAKYPERGDGKGGLISFLRQQYATMSIDIEASLPASIEVEVATSSGDVELARMLAGATITTSSGDVVAADVSGSLRITAASGDVSAERVEGAASLSTASGDIGAFRIAKRLTVQTASGDIEAGEIGGDIEASSASGDISVDGASGIKFSGTSGEALFRGVRGGVTASLATGDVTIEAEPAAASDFEITTSSGMVVLSFLTPLPGGFALRVETTSGEIQVSLPITVRSVGRHKLAGVVGGGGSVVRVQTASGDISITESED